MSELIFYHNPRCSKSRETEKLLMESGQKFITREYLDKPLSKSELKELYGLLSEDDRQQFVRKKEDLYKENPFDLKKDNLIFENLAKLPKLMERPIVSNGKLAIIGRPPEKIQQLIK